MTVGDDLISTSYGCEQVEDVATFIPLTHTDDTVGMSASVESNKEPHVAPGSLVVTSTARVIRDESNERGYIQYYDSQCLTEMA